MEKAEKLERLMTKILKRIGREIEIVRDCAQTFHPFAEECVSIVGEYEKKKEGYKLHPLIRRSPEIVMKSLEKRFIPSNIRINKIVNDKGKDIDTKLREIYIEITIDMRNGIGPVYNFIGLCRKKYGGLPDQIKEDLENAENANKDFDKANTKIGWILGRLPEYKIKEYDSYKKKLILPKESKRIS